MVFDQLSSLSGKLNTVMVAAHMEFDQRGSGGKEPVGNARHRVGNARHRVGNARHRVGNARHCYS